jgi:two-component system, chemotaxis family, CheB/CheR fusion protein
MVTCRRMSSLRVVVVGGYEQAAICHLLGALPARSGFAVLVSCPDQPDLLKNLRAGTKLQVLEGQDGQRLELDHVYVIPPNKDVVQRRGELSFSAPTVPGVQLDRLLRSVADEVDREAVVAIVGGVGTDGTLGAKRIKESGGLVLVQEPTEGPLAEMPRSVIASGAVDQVGPIDELAAQLARLAIDLGEVTEDDDARGDGDVTDTLRDILALVRVRSGHDFGPYKRATLYRRVARRMQVCGSHTIADYHQFLRDHPAELSHLLRDFLISVTNFFRDPEAYAALAQQTIPRLFAERRAGDHVRAWVAGCATGEEAYSLGMLMLEHASKLQDPPQIQLFATDIDEDALTQARAGRYPESIAVDVSPERLERFFVREAGAYRVNQELRELVLFSPHNLLRDPPFSRLDLVSCRNLLIYLNREAQNRVLTVFHFGLRPEGHLFLGSSESAEGSSMFSALDPKFRIFTRRMVPSTLGESIVTAGRWTPPPQPIAATPPADRTTTFGELHHRLVERYAPPSILVNGELDVVHLSEHAGKFLELAGGEPTRNILCLIHPALRLDLRTSIYAARQADLHTDGRRIVFDDNGKRRAIDLRVRTVDLPELGPNSVLIYLDETEPSATEQSVEPTTDKTMEPVVREIEDELRRTRDQLRTTIEQYETSLEELKASNEELQAINEELRSASEELETSKEELQSVNEELTTLNHELKVKIDEVSHANSDLQNLMTSTDIGVIFLDRTLNIKRFTPRALDLFNMIPSDIGRPLAHLTHRLDTDEIPDLAQRVLQDLRTIERDVVSRDGHRYLARMLPYRSLEDRIEGVVLTFVDVSEQRRTAAALLTSEARLRASLRSAPLIVLSLDRNLNTVWGYVLGQELAPGTADAMKLVAPYDAERFAKIAKEVTATGIGQRAEIELQIAGQARAYDVRVEAADGGITAVGFDITTSKEAEISLRDADRRKDEFLATLSHELRNPLTPLKVALDVARLSNNDPQQLAKSQGIMERQVNALTELVDELLDLSRITQGKLDLDKKPVDLRGVIDNAIESTKPLFTESKHSIDVQLPTGRLRVLGDASRLTQVVVNLLSNAAKYTPAGGHVKLALSYDRDRIQLRVSDDGVGISPEVLPRIFDIFVQSRDAIGRSRGGLGIGLNLVKRLVELHGGSVSAASPGPNQGSEFTVELPLNAS